MLKGEVLFVQVTFQHPWSIGLSKMSEMLLSINALDAFFLNTHTQNTLLHIVREFKNAMLFYISTWLASIHVALRFAHNICISYKFDM